MTVQFLFVILAVLLGKEPCTAVITTTDPNNTHLLRRQLVEETTAADVHDDVTTAPIVKYSGTMGMTCQRKYNIPGEVDINYTLVRNLTLKGCMEACSAANDVTQKKGSGTTSTDAGDDVSDVADSSEEVDKDLLSQLPFCAGYQHTTFDEGTTECHLWYHYGPGEGEEDPNSVCFWKVVSNPTQQCCVPTLAMETELCANEGVGSTTFSSVQCGPNQCEYDDYCLALVAGHFHQEECMEQCAEPMNAYNCDGQLFSPVQCMTKGTTSDSRSINGEMDDDASVLKCTYDNLCLAQQAGYTTLDSICEDVCPSVGTNINNANEKRTASSAFTCATDDDSSSTSTFGSATRSPSSTSCEGNTTSTTTSNAQVGGGGAAAATNGVVLCGTHQCPYDTICDGIKAGFSHEQCVPI